LFNQLRAKHFFEVSDKFCIAERQFVTAFSRLDSKISLDTFDFLDGYSFF